MGHVTRINESCPTYVGITSHELTGIVYTTGKCTPVAHYCLLTLPATLTPLLPFSMSGERKEASKLATAKKKEFFLQSPDDPDD